VRLLSPESSLIGLDLCGRAIRAVQLAGPPGAQRLEASVELERSDPDAPLSDADLRRVIDVLDRRAFQGRRVVIGLDGSALTVETLSLPPRSSNAPVDTLARNELAEAMRRQPEEIESITWDLPDEGRGRKGAPVMGVATLTETPTRLVDQLADAGLIVHAVDVRALATARAGLFALGPQPGMAVFLDIDWNRAELIVTLEGAVIHIRRLDDVALVDLHQQVQKVLDVEPEHTRLLLTRMIGGELAEGEAPSDVVSILDDHWQRVADELRLSMSYLEHRHPQAELACIALAGPAARDPRLAVALKRVFAVAPRVIDTEQVMPGARLPASMHTALGLALWDSEGTVPSPSLMPRSRKNALRVRARAATWAAVLCVYALLVAVGSVGLILSTPSKAHATTSLHALDREIEETRDDISAVADRIAEQSAVLRTHRSLQGHPRWSLLLDLIASRANDSLSFSIISLSPVAPATEGDAPRKAPDSHKLLLAGQAASQGDVTNLLLELEELDLFHKVALVNAHRQAEQEEADTDVDFTIVCHIQERES